MIHSLVNVTVKPLIANPLMGFRKLEQVAEPHANPLPHTSVRRCGDAWTTGTSLMYISVLRLSLWGCCMMLFYWQCCHFGSWCSHRSSLPCRGSLWSTLWWWAWQHCINNIIVEEEAILLTDTSRLETTWKSVKLQHTVMICWHKERCGTFSCHFVVTLLTYWAKQELHKENHTDSLHTSIWLYQES